MAEPVLTPITQALADGTITRKELKTLMKRSNIPGLIRLSFWFATMAGTGTLVWLGMGSWWVVPAMFVHGILLVHHFSLQHECTHFTAFRTRWLNNLVGAYCGFVIMLPPKFFRYEHCDHHTYTQVHGHDPEMIELPISFRKYLEYISSWPYWKTKFRELFMHIAGRLTPVEEKFIPEVERKAVFWEARVMGIAYLIIVVAMFVFNWWAPIWYWFLPMILGEPVMRMIRMTEHVGRPTIKDMTENTRSNLVSAPMRFLAWNMNYHAEHHYASSIPFYALPKLHKKLKGHIYVEERGYWGAHVDILAQIFGRKPRIDQETELT